MNKTEIKIIRYIFGIFLLVEVFLNSHWSIGLCLTLLFIDSKLKN